MRSPTILQRRLPLMVAWAIVVMALALAGQWLQAGVHLNHDVSHFVHFDRWLLQGRTLCSDLFDGNLPMVGVLFMPRAAFGPVLVAALAPQMGLQEAVDCAQPG